MIKFVALLCTLLLCGIYVSQRTTVPNLSPSTHAAFCIGHLARKKQGTKDWDEVVKNATAKVLTETTVSFFELVMAVNTLENLDEEELERNISKLGKAHCRAIGVSS
jgi:hypothetical protein